MRKGSLVVKTCVFLLFLFVVGVMTNPNKNYNATALTYNPKTSQTIEVDPIVIVENYTDFVAMYDWFTGSGTIEDPYVIEGISIGNLNGTAGIRMINGSKNLIIRNCNFYNITAPYGYWGFAAIYMDKGKLLSIENCNFTYCYRGLTAIKSVSMNITGCNFISMHDDPIYGLGTAIDIEEKAKDIIISNNKIINWYTGIYIKEAKNAVVDGNYIENLNFKTAYWDNETNSTYYVYHTADTGVYYYNVSDSFITDNDFLGCDYSTDQSLNIHTASLGTTPIFLDLCTNIQVYGNRFYDYNGNLIGYIPSLDPLPFLFIFIGLGIIAFLAILYLNIIQVRKKDNGNK